MPVSIAIDGPSGAGKSTIAKALAKKLGFIYLDTGAMYRAVGLHSLRQKINTKDAEGVESLLDDISIKIEYNNDTQVIFLNGEDVSSAIRQPEVSIAASDVSAIPAVRIKLVQMQREIASQSNVIMDGRDIGTYVLPNADLKIYLTASVEARSDRRYAELVEKGVETTYSDVKADIEYRDRNDSTRAFAPLRIARDAIVVDTSNLTLDESVEKINRLIEKMVI